jgi:predicted TIM-barrel fold metal-dependent hydrolase
LPPATANNGPGLRIVDSNVLFGFWPRRRLDASLGAIAQVATAFGIGRQVVCSIRGIFSDFVAGNDETVRACARDARLTPAATLNPLRWLEGADEIDRMAAAGVRIFRFFPEHQGWDYRLRPFRRLLRHIRGAGAVAMTGARLGGHLEAGAVSLLLTALEDAGARCILTGAYYGNLAEVLEAARAYPGLYVETHLLNGPESLELVAAELGARRLVFGSGTPLHYAASALLPLRHAALDEDDRQDIAGRNVARLLGWPDADH